MELGKSTIADAEDRARINVVVASDSMCTMHAVHNQSPLDEAQQRHHERWAWYAGYAYSLLHQSESV